MGKAVDDISGISGIAVDFGGTKIAASRVANGVIVDRFQVKTDGQAEVSDQIAVISDLLEQLSIQPSDKLGVAVSGRVSAGGEWHALNTDTLANISAIPLRKILSEKFSRDVVVENDAIAAANGEFIAGAIRGYEASAFITVSTGVGGGLILGGKPLISRNGLAGHVGFTTSRNAKHVCGCGRDKTVESIASGRAIARYAVELGYQGYDAKAVFEAHLLGKEWASGLITRSADTVGELCANLAATLGLEAISLGGSIGLASGYLELVKKALDSEPETFRPTLNKAALGGDAALIGILAL